MKQKTFFLLVFLIVIYFPLPVSLASSSSSSIQALALQLSSPKAIAQWMKKNLDFKEDQAIFGTEDYWQSAQEILKRKAGDCEDYAILAKALLDELGMESYVISFYGPNDYAHTIVLFKDKGGYNVMNEDRLYHYHSKTVEEALSRVHPEWTWGGVAEIRAHRGWLVFALQNPSRF